MRETWDVIIVGGGLAGLSLAAELAEPQFSHVKVLVLEQRTHYVRDRTWSYWARQAHRYTPLERKRWNQWQTSLDGRVKLQKSDRAYCTLDADAFYGQATRAIEASANVQLRMGVSVQQIAEGTPAQVSLRDGAALDAQWVMDARPRQTVPSGFIAQHFEGWEIEADCDCFDPQSVDLMDFQRSNDGLHFFYVLPYSTRSALVETTWVSRWAAGVDYAGQLDRYLSTRWPGMRHRKVYREQGILHMVPQSAQTVNRLVPLGRNAGTLRLSTGFAFLNTIADASRIAGLIGQAAPGSPLETIEAFQPPSADLWMDKIFLEALQANWWRAPEYFMAMFEQVHPLALTAFLSGSSSIAQRVEVAMSLPKADFIQAAWHYFSRRA
jgi:lycopene beta-cyclase